MSVKAATCIHFLIVVANLITIRLIGMITCCHPPKLQIGSLS